ncbi:cytoskeleton-associated protein 2-like isoform X2 [Pempheris klunzingeri]|uniref:cytoskeleton-associated protein 2-like isoform X2 n=1 Tax=Pempheris klunzingeri TaxID=3127111 RepID=UPI00397F0E14
MEEGETVSILSRKELRKQKLMEYLAAKGKLKQTNPKPNLHDDCQVKKPVSSALKILKGKENEAPAGRFRYERTKVQTLAAKSLKGPTRTAFGVTNKVNVKVSLLIGMQDDSCSPVTSGTQSKYNQNPALTSTKNTVSSKSNLNAASHLKNLPDTGSQSSGRFSSNAACTAGTKSNCRFSSSSNAARSSQMRTASARISLGPIVKTKTGLIPAVTQPRNSGRQNLTLTSAPAAATTSKSVANKVRSSTSSSISVYQRSALAQRKTLPAAALNNPVNKRISVSSTARAGVKVQNQIKSNSKPVSGKHYQLSCKIQLSSGLKSTSTSSKCSAAHIKPEWRVGMPKTDKTGQSTHVYIKQRSEGEGEKSGRPSTSQAHSGIASGCISRAANAVMRAAVAELSGKTKKCKETESKKGRSSVNAPPPQTTVKRTGAPVSSQTVPRPARTISHTGQATDMKTPKIPVRLIPQTEGNKLTAVQEERMRKLQEWREAKGISYKRPPMPVKLQVRRTVAEPQSFWATMKEEDEAHSLICAVDRSLADCIKLLGEGCPPHQVKEVLSRLPAVSKKFAKYWICQARLMEQEGNLAVLPMFEEAVRVVLEPVDELRTVVFEILKKKDEIQAEENEAEDGQISTCETPPESIINNPMMTPKPVRALICGEKGDSSVVKYKITATPGGPPSQQKEPARINGQEVRFFTPVRRSVRIERASLRYPASLQDHDLCVASYNDLISGEDNEESEEQRGGEANSEANNTPMYVYRQNEALKDKVLVQLVCDEHFQP